MRKVIFTVLFGLVLFLFAKLFLFKGGEEISPGKVFTVQEIKSNARDFEQKIVTIHGTVTGSGSLALGGYTVDDGTGTMIVFTTHAVPNKGEKVKVKGKIVQAAKIGNNQQMTLNEIELVKD